MPSRDAETTRQAGRRGRGRPAEASGWRRCSCTHYRKIRLCRLPVSFPTAFLQAVGKGALCRLFFSGSRQRAWQSAKPLQGSRQRLAVGKEVFADCKRQSAKTDRRQKWSDGTEFRAVGFADCPPLAVGKGLPSLPTAKERQSAKKLFPDCHVRQSAKSKSLPTAVPRQSAKIFLLLLFFIPVFFCGQYILFEISCSNLGPFYDILLYFIQLFYFLAFSRIVQI